LRRLVRLLSPRGCHTTPKQHGGCCNENQEKTEVDEREPNGRQNHMRFSISGW
jgi:hypothetical protein